MSKRWLLTLIKETRRLAADLAGRIARCEQRLDKGLATASVDAADVVTDRIEARIEAILDTQREFSNRLIAIEKQLKQELDDYVAVPGKPVGPTFVEWNCPKCGGRTCLDPARMPMRCITCDTPAPGSLEAIREATAGAWDGTEPQKDEGTVVKPDPPAKPAWWESTDTMMMGDWDGMPVQAKKRWLALAEAIIEAHFPDRAALVAEVRGEAINDVEQFVWEETHGRMSREDRLSLVVGIRRLAEKADE